MRKHLLVAIGAASLALAAVPATAQTSDDQTVTASLGSTLAVNWDSWSALVDLGELGLDTNTTWHPAGSIGVTANLLTPYTVTVAGAPLSSTTAASSLGLPLNISLTGGTVGLPVATTGTTLVSLSLGDGALGGTATYTFHLNQVVGLTDTPASDYETTLTYTVAPAL